LSSVSQFACILMFEVTGKSIALPCFGTSVQFGCISQSFVQICSSFLVILLLLILLPMQVCISVRLTNFILALVDLQLDAQNSYLFTYNTFIKILYMLRALPCSSSGGLRHNYIYIDIYIYMQPLVSSLCKLHCVKCTYDVDLLRMSRVMLETCRGF
jgi:hypothetical protein